MLEFNSEINSIITGFFTFNKDFLRAVWSFQPRIVQILLEDWFVQFQITVITSRAHKKITVFYCNYYSYRLLIIVEIILIVILHQTANISAGNFKLLGNIKKLSLWTSRVYLKEFKLCSTLNHSHLFKDGCPQHRYYHQMKSLNWNKSSRNVIIWYGKLVK